MRSDAIRGHPRRRPSKKVSEPSGGRSQESQPYRHITTVQLRCSDSCSCKLLEKNTCTNVQVVYKDKVTFFQRDLKKHFEMWNIGNSMSFIHDCKKNKEFVTRPLMRMQEV